MSDGDEDCYGQQLSHDRMLRAEPVVGVGVVDACRGDVVQPLTVCRRWFGDVDDVGDFGAAEARDLHCAHVSEARGCPSDATPSRSMDRSGRRMGLTAPSRANKAAPPASDVEPVVRAVPVGHRYMRGALGNVGPRCRTLEVSDR